MPDETTGNDPAISITARIVAAYVVKHTVPAAQLSMPREFSPEVPK